jgi:hypothetical protein
MSDRICEALLATEPRARLPASLNAEARHQNTRANRCSTRVPRMGAARLVFSAVSRLTCKFLERTTGFEPATLTLAR